MAKHFQKVATTWGIELPADFLEIAKRYEPKAVSTETVDEEGAGDDHAE
jgi:hypothetical protein